MIADYLNRIINIDCKSGISNLTDNSIDCVVTSPPYFGLRDYGISEQIGLEETPDLYIEKLLQIFSEVYRVLKKEGTFWLNIGDSYAGSGHGYLSEIKDKQATNKGSLCFRNRPPAPVPKGLKAKDLIGIPWMLAFALRESGWYLRQDIIWNKTNPMPESVRDRCTKSHEYIFLLTKSKKYYFNYEAILEPAAFDGRKDTMMKGSQKYAENYTGLNQQSFASKGHERCPNKIRGYATKEGNIGLPASYHGINIQTYPARNKRDVWTLSTKPLKEAHFASYPPELILPCILAGCPEQGIVLDPFMGSGTTAIVAKQNNRNYIGFELNPEYVSIAEKRINSI